MNYKIRFDGIEGYVEVKLLTGDEKFRFALNNKELEIKEDASVEDNIALLKKIIPKIKKQIVKVDLKTDEYHITDMKDLEYFQDYYEIIFECIGVIFNGPRLGKQKPEPLSNNATESTEVLQE